MKRYMVLGIGLVATLLLVPALTGVSQQPETKSALRDELKVGERAWFIRVGENYSEQGFPGKVLAVDGDWVKVEEQILNRRQIWVNLNHVGAIWKAAPGEKDEKGK